MGQGQYEVDFCTLGMFILGMLSPFSAGHELTLSR
jgi:hypothetical protein